MESKDTEGVVTGILQQHFAARVRCGDTGRARVAVEGRDSSGTPPTFSL